MYIRSFSIDWSGEIGRSYVADIEAIRVLDSFTFQKNITFFAGENGSGKSTLLEALAIACGLNPEGGTANYNFSTYDDYSELGSAITLCRGLSRPEWSYFLRAESFYNVASAAVREYNLTDYHARSHGESFLEFIQSVDVPGLYFMDEPEAALSPQRQLTLLIYLVRMAQRGSQFVIATHSPILLGTPDEDIYSFDDGRVRKVSYEETDSYQITKMFIENRSYLLERLLRDEEESENESF